MTGPSSIDSNQTADDFQAQPIQKIASAISNGRKFIHAKYHELDLFFEHNPSILISLNFAQSMIAAYSWYHGYNSISSRPLFEIVSPILCGAAIIIKHPILDGINVGSSLGRTWNALTNPSKSTFFISEICQLSLYVTNIRQSDLMKKINSEPLKQEKDPKKSTF
jgi:hypothetical protein